MRAFAAAVEANAEMVKAGVLANRAADAVRALRSVPEIDDSLKHGRRESTVLQLECPGRATDSLGRCRGSGPGRRRAGGAVGSGGRGRGCRWAVGA